MLVSTKGCGLSIERSTCVSAARLTTEVGRSSANTRAIASRSAMSALTNLTREPQLFCQRIDGGTCALPGALGLEAQVADSAAPRRDHAADGAKIAPIG